MPTPSKATTSLAALVRAAFAADNTAPPCFYWARCRQRAVLDKAGRSVCRPCSATLRGAEYPLRHSWAEASYASDRVAAEALDMLEEKSGTDPDASHFAEETHADDSPLFS